MSTPFLKDILEKAVLAKIRRRGISVGHPARGTVRILKRLTNGVVKCNGESIIGVVSDTPKEKIKRLLFTYGYLADCGSAIPFLPPTPEEKCHPRPTEYILSSANG